MSLAGRGKEAGTKNGGLLLWCAWVGGMYVDGASRRRLGQQTKQQQNIIYPPREVAEQLSFFGMEQE